MNPDPVAVHHIRPVLTFSALQRDVIRTVAFLAMAGDHLATAFQADLPLLNMAGRLKREGSAIRVRHVAEVLAGVTEAPPIGDAS